MFPLAVVVFEAIPLLVLVLAWHYWRGTESPRSNWRNKLLLAGLCAATANLAMYYVEVIYEFNLGNRHWTVFGYLADTGLLLCLFSLLAAGAGTGRGRMLLALTALLSFSFWILLTGPVFL